jgi:thiosulfate/3-mercaptopyruvate sulfurtransferase
MLVSTDWLAKHLKDPKVAVIHIASDRKHYDDGHLPGARFLAMKEIVITRNNLPNELPAIADLQKVFESLGVGNELRVVIYGDNSGLSAARLWFTLDYLGHGDRAALLDGGIEKWKSEKREVSTQYLKPEPAAFTPKPRPRVIVELARMRDLSWVAANIKSPDVAIIDARPARQFDGSESGGVQRPGHIPGAASIYWMQNLVSGENPVMKPTAELRRLYEAAGAAPGKLVVTYCRTGVQSSHAYFTAKYLGYDATMYDGSFIEWSATQGTEIAR